MDQEVKLFEGWAIVDLFGHSRIAGLCSEQPLAGTNMLRVDVPAINGKPAFTRFFGGGAIYSITPTDEQTAKIALGHIDVRPVERWIVPDQPARLPSPPEMHEDLMSEDLDDICTCGHKRSSHDGPGGSCGYFMDELIGDCPCMEFEVAG